MASTASATSEALKPPEESQAVQRRKRSRSTSGDSNENTRKESLGGAVARSLLGSLAFFFRLPIRLFRPVKLSSWTVLESFAKREKKTLSLKYLVSLIRREKNSFLFHLLGPPIVFNTLVGFTLFESYSLCEAHLLKKHRAQQRKEQEQSDNSQQAASTPTSWTPLWIVTVAGSVAGAAQCILSAPLDNVRLVLASHRPVGRSRGGVGRTGRARGPHRSARQPSLISWRSVMKAAILPFAPLESQHRRLVRSVQQQAVPSPSALRKILSLDWWHQGEPLVSKQQRKVLRQTLKHWSGGVHGSGLLMSLARDSVGFGSFFFIFEVSRRLAHGTSLLVDRSIAWFNTSAAIPSPSTYSSREVSVNGEAEQKSHHLDVDFSYNASRTKTGRVVAAFVLLVGGAIGAFAYEWVGRPFELMRVVIWHGRRKWEKERARRRARVVRGGRSERHVLRRINSTNTNGTGLALGPVSLKRRRKVQELKERDGLASTTPAPDPHRVKRRRRLSNTASQSSSRLESLLTLRAANSGGSRLSRLTSLLDGNHPPHPLRSIGKRAKQQNRAANKSQRPAAPVASPPPSPPPPHVAPSALSLLLEHAENTSTLAYTSSSRKFRTAVPAPVLLVHTYFLAPYLNGSGIGSTPELSTSASGSSSSSASAEARPSRTGQLHQHLAAQQPQKPKSQTTISAARLLTRWTHRNPVSSTIALPSQGATSLAGSGATTGSAQAAYTGATFLPPRPASAPSSPLSKFGQGRVAWALRRLASPYGIGFVAFAWMSGDV